MLSAFDNQNEIVNIGIGKYRPEAYISFNAQIQHYDDAPEYLCIETAIHKMP